MGAMHVISEFDVLKMHSYCLAISCDLQRSLSNTRLLTERNSDLLDLDV